MENEAAEEKSGYLHNFRWVDNIHILLWLLKDMSWAMMWRPGGIFMIVPTMGVAIYILIKSRQFRSELFHNIAVCLWIMANSAWMLGEFFHKETRHFAVVFFILGVSVLGIYYLFFFRADRQKEKGLPMTIK